MLRWQTAGESHGEALVAMIEGLPAGVRVTSDDVVDALARRRLGYGRGARMKFEQDKVRLLTGVRFGETLGSPVAIEIANTEWPKWTEVMSADPLDHDLPREGRNAPLSRPRPGHADLTGMRKYGFDDARPVLERSSARETASRVALGAVAARFLEQAFGIRTVSHVISIGGAGVEDADDAALPTPDDVEALDKALDEYNAKTGYDIPIHVDAASGGFILPFLNPEVKWDFRLKWVWSISTSGHKYGLVYPGLGWVVWKDKKYLPEEMSFSVNYLGANITQVGLNFSRPAAQILGQYYNFIRLGFDGYKEVQQNSMDVACYCHEQIGKMKCFENYSKELQNPLFIWYMNPEYDKTAKWTLYDLQAVLQQSGWMVPAYTMPKNIDSLVVMRVVVRQGMSRDMADMLLSDIGNAVAGFEKLKYPTQSRLDYEAKVKQKGRVFTH